MKSNVPMTRKMGNFDVIQRTRDGMFNASLLIKQWNRVNGNAELRISKYLKQKNTIAFIEAMKDEKDGANQPIPDNQIVTKSRRHTDKRGRVTGAEYWMHPFLFIKFSMWLNPKFELQVIKFVYDELIKNRHLAGDNYVRLSSAASIFPDTDYRRIAKGLNYIVFGKHEREIRNFATPKQLDELHKVEEQLAFSIDMGLILNYPQLIKVMREMYHKKFDKF